MGIGLITTALVAVVGTAGLGVANAQHGDSAAMPPSKEACKNGGWQDLGYKNQGQCIAGHDNQQPPGGGYGGSNGNTVNANVNLSLNNSDNNVINVIIRVIVGG